MSRSAQTITYVALVLLLSVVSKASVFTCEGKEVSKGQAVKIMANNNKANCTKTDRLEFNEDKGTLKNKSN